MEGRLHIQAVGLESNSLEIKNMERYRHTRRQFLLECLELCGGVFLGRKITKAMSEEWTNLENPLAVSPYAILEILIQPNTITQPHPGPVIYETNVSLALNEPVTILKAKAELLTRPASVSQALALDLSAWEGVRLSPGDSLQRTQEIDYDPQFEDSVVTQQLIFLVALAEEKDTRILTSRSEVAFGKPPAPARGTWPATGYVSAWDKYFTGLYHNVWQREYKGAVGTAIDIQAQEGTPVFSPFSGIARTQSCYITPGYGNQVILTTQEGIDLSFAHLSRYWDESTRAGLEKEVAPGDLIGYVGKTGSGAGYPHLHYEVHAMNPNSIREKFMRISEILPAKTELYIGLHVKSDFSVNEKNKKNIS